ncbi:hypothetical protein GF339_22460, partial [candidate division KSB3 bacterium]|nr:hypothetical protein [candidate division KSB3 bacterium]MBD3327366.1 hypothetical protein [candidate division KSB3 bacterium]
MKHVGKHLAVLCLFTAVTVLFLFPLPLNLNQGLLAAQSGDPLLQIWVIQWNIHKLTTSLTNYFDANIFYPYPNTFAYHDHMFGVGLLGLPIYLLSHNPLLTYNCLLLISFVLSAYGMYLLCRDLTQNAHAALIAGLIFGFLPYRFAHLDHLNLLSIHWLPFCMLFLTRLFFLNSRKTAKIITLLALFWGCYLLQVLTSFNYLFMLTFALGIFILITLVVQWKILPKSNALHSPRKIGLFIVGVCLVGLLLLPFALPYFRAHREMGFQRTLQEAESLSARIQDYWVAPERNLLYGNITQTFKSQTSPFPREQILFPGILPLILTFIGIVGILGQSRFAATPRKSGLRTFLGSLRLHKQSSRIDVLRISYLSLLLIAGLLSLGPTLTLGGKSIPLPYRLLYQFVPGFNSMRVPARFGVLVFFAMAVLSAIGVAQFSEYAKRYLWAHNYRLKQLLTTTILAVIILLEYASVPGELSTYPATLETIPPVYQWLAGQPGQLRIAELPADTAKANFEYAYYSTFHWQRLINGRSAFIPTGTARLFAAMQHFPFPKTLTLLQTLGVHYVIWHADRTSQPLPENLPPGFQFSQSFGTDLVLTVPQAPALWENSGNFVEHALHVRYHTPAVMRPGNPVTLGLELQASSAPFCPLPYENFTLDLEWSTPAQLISE